MHSITLHARVAWWRNGRASGFRPQGREFDPRSRRSCVTTLGKLLTPTCLEGSPVSSLKCDRAAVKFRAVWPLPVPASGILILQATWLCHGTRAVAARWPA